METTHTKEKDGLKVTVKIEKGTMNKTAYADGHNVPLGKETYNFTFVKIEKGGKSAFTRDLNFFYIVDRSAGRNDNLPKEAFARFGDTYISKPVYNTIKAVVDEATAISEKKIDEEYYEVKSIEDSQKADADKNETEILKMETERAKHPGWCDKCYSYCWGDCQAN